MVRGKSIKAIPAVLAAVLMVVLLAQGALAAAGASAPTGLKVGLPTSSNGGCLKLTWRVSAPSLIAGYKVYRSSEADRGFEVVHSDSAYTRLNVMEYIDTGLKDGATYYYRVTLVGADGRQSAPSNTARGDLAARSSADLSGGAGEKRIIISTYDQRIYLFEGNVMVKTHLCSTGTASHPTPYGVFSVLNHDYCAVSVKYGGVYMYYWMGFAPDIGMHALPYDPKSKTWTSASCLGHAASHGCVRQALQDAQWAYNWAPNGTRIDVIASHFEYTPPPPPPPPLTGGHGTAGIDRLSTQWYFAEGCTAWNFNQYICMMNPTDRIATVNAQFMRPDGSVVGGNYSVGPLSRATINIADVEGLEDVEISTHLSSDVAIAAERSMYFHDYKGKNGGTDSRGVSAPGTEWHLAEGYTGGDFDEYVLVQNPGAQAGTVHVRYMRPDGATFEYDYPIKPTSRMSLHVDDIPELAATDVSTTVTCDVPVVVERAQYFNYYGRDDGTANAAVAAPSPTWYLAEGYTGGEFDTYVLIQNPGANATRAQVTFMRSDGLNVTRTYDMLPFSRFTVRVDDIPEFQSAEVSTKVEAEDPVIVERSVYYVSYGRTGGSDAAGVAEPTRYWYLAEGYTGGEYDTYVLIMNPNDEAVTVDVNYLTPKAGIKVASHEVEANSRYTIHVDAIEGLTDTEFSTALTGDKPIVCERAMYFRVPVQ